MTTDGTTQTRTHNQQNQLTSISSPDQTPAYDNNGNTTQDEKGRALVYDAWDRLVEMCSRQLMSCAAGSGLAGHCLRTLEQSSSRGGLDLLLASGVQADIIRFQDTSPQRVTAA